MVSMVAAQQAVHFVKDMLPRWCVVCTDVVATSVVAAVHVLYSLNSLPLEFVCLIFRSGQ